jgi:RNA polymerase-binding transcription factor DksA
VKQKRRSQLEQRLLRERERAVRAFQALDERVRVSPADDDGSLTMYPLHLADQGTDTIEQEKDLLLLSTEGRLLYSIDEALRTLYRTPEAYGRCGHCGAEISMERLDLIPWAKLCMDCQQSAETGPEPAVVAA